MVHVKDEGSHFDAPIDVVWKFNQNAEEHGRAHKQKNGAMKPVTENQFVVSWDQDMEGKTVHMSNRITILPPTGMAIEVLEGPMAGSKFFNIYTAKGSKTEVTVIGEFTSKMIPEAQLAGAVMGFLDAAFKDDNQAIAKMAGKK
jgi:hypothetical protein